MTKVLVLGANGGLARLATDLFLQDTDAYLTLYLRSSGRLKKLESDRVRVVEGDVVNKEALRQAMEGQDVIYANLSGKLEQMSGNIVEAMNASGVKRLIFISSMGIYDEVPGEKYGSVLEPHRKSARIVEDSDLDYTILRPAWFNNTDEIDYETTQKGEPFKGSTVSRKSVADLVVKLAVSPDAEIRSSLGVNKPVK